MVGIFDPPWKVSAETRRAFGKHWVGPETVPHVDAVLVARYEIPPESGDGRMVEVYMSSAPAEFFEIRVYSRHGLTPQVVIHTGSSMAKAAAMIADGFATGMLGIREGDDV